MMWAKHLIAASAVTLTAFLAASNSLAQEEFQLILMPAENEISDTDWLEVRNLLSTDIPELPRYFREAAQGFSRGLAAAKWFDFDEDGIDELFVAIENIVTCGTAGCNFFVLMRDAGAFALLADGFAWIGPEGMAVSLQRGDDGAWVIH